MRFFISIFVVLAVMSSYGESIETYDTPVEIFMDYIDGYPVVVGYKQNGVYHPVYTEDISSQYVPSTEQEFYAENMETEPEQKLYYVESEKENALDDLSEYNPNNEDEKTEQTQTDDLQETTPKTLEKASIYSLPTEQGTDVHTI